MAARDGRGCLPASHPEFLHVDWSVSGRLKPKPSNEEEATEEGNFGVRVDVCPRDKSNEIHYNRDVSCALGRTTASIYSLPRPNLHSRRYTAKFTRARSSHLLKYHPPWVMALDRQSLIIVNGCRRRSKPTARLLNIGKSDKCRIRSTFRETMCRLCEK